MLRERLDSEATAASEASTNDKKCRIFFERELRNCYQEIEFLQDELNLRNAEVNFMADHVKSLEKKLAGVEKLNERLKVMDDELAESDARNLFLMREMEFKDQELLMSSARIENLENIVIDCQCEVESLKLDITSLEQRCFEADRNSQDIIEEKAMRQELESCLKDTKNLVRSLENDKKELEVKAMLLEGISKQSCLNAQEQLVKWLEETNIDGSSDGIMQLNLRKNLPLSSIMSSEYDLGQFLSKLAAIAACDEHVKNEIERRDNQIHEYEHLLEQLKNELVEIKLKAKEEGEDLIQEMAELRYQHTCMLEEESKRRAFVEQVSIQKIQDLEAEVCIIVKKEKKKYVLAFKHLQEVNELAESQSIEIRKLKKVVKELHVPINFGIDHRTEPCTCGYFNTSESSLDTELSIDTEASEVISSESKGQALVEWCTDDASTNKYSEIQDAVKDE